MDRVLRWLRTAWRPLLKRPGFTLAAILTLALAIGPNVMLFTLVDGILFRPLHYEEPDELVMLWSRQPGAEPLEATFAKPEWGDVRDHVGSLQEVGAFAYGGSNVEHDGGVTVMWTGWISSNLLSMLGVEAVEGRTYLPEEFLPGAPDVAMISHGFWQDELGGTSDVVGSTLRLDGTVYTIVGVLPETFQLPLDFQWPGRAPLILPLADPTQKSARDSRYVQVMGRLAEGTTLSQLGSELDSLGRGWAQEYPDLYPTGEGWRLEGERLHDVVVRDLRSSLLLLFAAVGLILLLACTNLTNLLLARALARKRESAIRLMLGAGRRRLAAHLLTESLLLTFLGGALGFLLARWSFDGVLALLPADLPRLDNVAMDFRVLAFTLGLSLVTGLILGLVPLFQLGRSSLQEVVQQGGRSSTLGSRELWVRRVLIVAEVALCLVLLVGAGLVLRSFRNLLDIPLGFSPERVGELGLRAPSGEYPEGYQVRALFDRVLEATGGVPGVRDVALATAAPLYTPPPTRGVELDESAAAAGSPPPTTPYQIVSANYFDVLSIPLRRGRTFTDRDRQGAQPVAVVNEAFVRSRRMPPDRVVGRRVRMADTAPDPESDGRIGEAAWRTIVGVVGDVRHDGPDGEAVAKVYLPYAQYDFPAGDRARGMFVMVQADVETESLATDVRKAVQAVIPSLPLGRYRTLEDLLAESMASRRFAMFLLTSFGVLAVLLAVTGIYGVLSYLTEQRRHEMGIRMALGAQRGDVVRRVWTESFGLTLVGIVLGLAGAYVASGLLSSLVFGVTTRDPTTYWVSSVVLVVVTFFSSLLPVRRATRVDPAGILQHE